MELCVRGCRAAEPARLRPRSWRRSQLAGRGAGSTDGARRADRLDVGVVREDHRWTRPSRRRAADTACRLVAVSRVLARAERAIRAGAARAVHNCLRENRARPKNPDRLSAKQPDQHFDCGLLDACPRGSAGERPGDVGGTASLARPERVYGTYRAEATRQTEGRSVGGLLEVSADVNYSASERRQPGRLKPAPTSLDVGAALYVGAAFRRPCDPVIALFTRPPIILALLLHSSEEEAR